MVLTTESGRRSMVAVQAGRRNRLELEELSEKKKI
jgi:hypothetical protein